MNAYPPTSTMRKYKHDAQASVPENSLACAACL